MGLFVRQVQSPLAVFTYPAYSQFMHVICAFYLQRHVSAIQYRTKPDTIKQVPKFVSLLVNTPEA